VTPDSEPPPHVLPDDLGPDLLAHVRGELEAERVAAIDALLAASSELRTEHARLAADHAAWAQALAERAPPPRRATLDALLAAVSGEAAERRARAAVAGSPRDDTALDDDVCADAVALALDQLDGDDRQRIERLVGADPRLAHAADVAGRLAAATRTAFA
jgi:anti-sigma factor RsiW